MGSELELSTASALPQLYRRDLVEVAIGFTLILLTVWTPRPAHQFFFWSAFAWIVIVCMDAHRRGEIFGLGTHGFRESLWAVGASLLFAVTVVVIAARLGTLHTSCHKLLANQLMWGYFISAFLQQFILQNFFLSRLLRLTGSRAPAILATASLFAFAHLPNLLLAVTTLVWGIGACLLFLSYRNLVSLAVMHFFFGVCIAVSVPSAIHHNMRVGISYLRYRPHITVPVDIEQPILSREQPAGSLQRGVAK